MADAVPCRPIPSLPFTIEASGSYCLTNDLVSSDAAAPAITVSADDVTIDLASYTILGLMDKKVLQIRILGDGVKRLLIQHGSILGFGYGIQIRSGGGHASDIWIRNISFKQNSFRGLADSAARSTIENNEFQVTGGTLVFPDAYAMAIEHDGHDCRIAGNRIYDTYPMGIGEGVGIYLDKPDGCVISGNRIENSAHHEHMRTFGMWLYVEDGQNASVLENQVTRFAYAFNVRRKVQFANNIGDEIACTPENQPLYYLNLPTSNLIRGDAKGCYDSIAARQYQLDYDNPPIFI